MRDKGAGSTWTETSPFHILHSPLAPSTTKNNDLRRGPNVKLGRCQEANWPPHKWEGIVQQLPIVERIVEHKPPYYRALDNSIVEHQFPIRGVIVEHLLGKNIFNLAVSP